jgi:two-component system OmpR family sensor kinase
MKTLHGKLSAVLLGLLCLTSLLYFALTLFTTRTYLWEVNQKLNQRLAADLATHLAGRNLLRPDPATQARARAEIKELMAINPSVEVYLLNAQGKILTYSVPPAEVKRQRVSLIPLRQFLQRGNTLPILGDDPRDFTRQKIFSAAEFSERGDTGYVYVILGGEDYDSASRFLERSVILRSSLVVAMVILTVVLIAGLFLFHLLTRRLRGLTRVIEQFQSGNSAVLPGQPMSSSSDEIERLGLVYEQMSQRIQVQMQALTQAASLRRELIGNVSHDLRTPLAALQGYLETLMMKEGSLTAEEQRDYLTIALRHSERLATLVTELFELARLDSHETQVHPEPFALGELAQDMVQQFALAGEKQQVTLHLDVLQDLPFVFADIGLIARVLENLLGNALRHTPAGGMITLGLAPQGQRVVVQVMDTGEGIDPESLPHIFERFYRAPHQASPSAGAGLGLAIARRILEMHGSRLDVESAPGQKTTFTFSLPTQSAAP